MRLLSAGLAVGLVLVPLAPQLCAAGTSGDGCPMMEMRAGEPCHTGAAPAMDCCFDGSVPVAPSPGQPAPPAPVELGAVSAGSATALPAASRAPSLTAVFLASDPGPKLFTLHAALLI